MTRAFQANAFQNNAFQVSGDAFVPPVVIQSVGGSIGVRRRRRIIEVEIDGEVFEVRSEAEGRELLIHARKLAKQAAQAAADKAAAKAITRDSPAAVKRALAVPVPKLKVVEPDYSDQLTQALQAQLEAAQAEIDEDYAQAIRVAYERHVREREQDEDDVITLLLL